MKKYEKIYKKLRKKLTDEEIVNAMLILQDLTEEEKRKSNEERKHFGLN